MANLYTKTGDQGQTSLIGGSRISKGELRVECYGTVDEMGAAMGFARALSSRSYVQTVLQQVQGRLFSLAAEIASDETGISKLSHLIDHEDVQFLESVVDKCTETTGVQTAFVIPGENPSSAALHMARTVVRRCERNLIRLAAEAPVRQVLIQYVNRLSDGVYALARLEETLHQQEALREKVEAEVRRRFCTEQPPLTLEQAEKMAYRAKEKAKALGISVVFAVVDAGGNLMLLQRMGEAFLGSIDVAVNKAYTANAFKMPTDALGTLCQPGQPLYGIEATNQGRMVVFGGGVPYTCAGQVTGAVGVSGGTVEEDMAVAHYALGEGSV